MPPVSFQSIAHIGTATSILSMDAVNFLIDPTFDNSGDFNQELGNFNQASGFVFVKTDDPTLGIEDLPVVDAILLSHEDHVDNLDASGRTMLNGRHVFTTLNGVKNLASPCPGVRGCAVGGCTGFVLESPSFGANEADGLPNVVYVSGDTVHIPELAKELPKRYHADVALMNLGKAVAPLPTGPVQIRMDGMQAAQLIRGIGAEKIHF
ncbi:Zn-dependent hydrolases of the beta-lactamase [Phytophthora cinnamomi]|uniref:Zn-dependent hydrolases of the beta-lactamase n=1 Tax=Phytophthora cinnamomi TaxID=4785 RepID=UPI00355AB50C|nr:Zn-dependent hydrolases of the beta-lactamase [Phytophthora cinnamomi]